MSEKVDVLDWIRLATTGLHCLCENSPAALRGREVGAAVAELIAVAKFAELLKFKQSSKNANAAFLDYRDCVHLQTIASAALARLETKG
jgi:hypothetical protein